MSFTEDLEEAVDVGWDGTKQKKADLLYKKAHHITKAIDGQKFKDERLKKCLCATCESFVVVKTQYSIVRALCGDYMITLRGEVPMVVREDDPVTECSNYVERGRLSLRDMVGMAYDLSTKEKVGFKPPKKEKK